MLIPRDATANSSVVVPVLTLHVSYGVEVSVLQRFGRGKSFLVIVPQQPVKKADGISVGQMLIFGRHKLLPRRARVATENCVEFAVEPHTVFVEISKEHISAQHTCNLDKLIVVVMAMKKRLPLEDERGEHATQAPHVEAVVVLLKIDEELWSFEISAGYTDVVLQSRVIELSQTPVNEAKLLLLMVDHDVMGLHISVYDALRVTELKCD